MQSTNIGYHSDSLLLKIYEKNFFITFLPLFLLSQSGTAQQDSLTLRITDEKGQIIIGAVVLQYPESYLLGASNEKKVR